LTCSIDIKQELVDKTIKPKKPKHMELLVAFLIAFGVVNTKADASKLSKEDAQMLVEKSDLKQDYIIWGAEADDF